MKKIITVMLMAALIVMIIPCAAVNAEGTEPGVRFEAVREDEETLRLDVVTNVALNFGGLALARVPICDTEVFTYTGVRSGVLSATKPNNPAKPILADTGDDLDVEANEVLFSVIYSIGEAYEEGADYTFTGTVSYVYDYDFVPYDWEGATITTTYSHKAPTVSFSECAFRERPEADAAGALRAIFKVTMNDSFVDYAGTVYGAESASNYEITALTIDLHRIDVETENVITVNCTKIYDMQANADEPYFLFNVTLTGITERHYSWTFEAVPTVTFVLNGEELTVTCGPAQFSAEGISVTD
jgi:hypothetical protein